MTNTGFQMPTETVELPSKGLLYAADNALSAGTVEMKYMTAKEEDILTNVNYVRDNIVFDKLLQSLIVTKINYNDLLVTDRDALLLAARILGYGADYTVNYVNYGEGINEEYTVDLSTLKTKEIDDSLVVKGSNSFKYTVPSTNTELTFKLLTVKDEKDIDKEIEGLKKINPQATPDLSTRLKYMITSVNGDSSKSTIRDFVDNYFFARDTKAFRKYVRSITPGIELKYDYKSENYTEEGVDLDLDANFFWPES